MTVKFCILMFYDHDVTILKQKPNIYTRCFCGLYNTPTRARMALWDVQYISFRLTQTFGFDTLQ